MTDDRILPQEVPNAGESQAEEIARCMDERAHPSLRSLAAIDSLTTPPAAAPVEAGEREDHQRPGFKWSDIWDAYVAGAKDGAAHPEHSEHLRRMSADAYCKLLFSRRVHGVVFVLYRDGMVLMEHNPAKGTRHGGGEWFFPGGRLDAEDSGDGQAAVRREMREEMGCVPTFSLPLPEVDAGIPGAPFIVAPYLVSRWDGEVPAQCLDSPSVAFRWCPLSEALESPTVPVRQIAALVAREKSPAHAAPSAANAASLSAQPPASPVVPDARQGHWWCPQCLVAVDARRVTYEEHHDACGALVRWVSVAAYPVTGERERDVAWFEKKALEYDRSAEVCMEIKPSAPVAARYEQERADRYRRAAAALRTPGTGEGA